ncbi:MAG: hypothetical protein JSW11_08690 [Candidatus Heimdallarchaeota archaeon]|nr:MAG: hypothetical protein JSW11_08690 [Candidatus Heimdallarchaeota archaeon]
MLKSKKEHPKLVKRFLLILIIGFIILPNFVTPSTADYVVIDWGDVVKMKVKITYRRPGGTDMFFSDGFLELYLGTTVPPDINETFNRVKTMSEIFRKRVIGMRVGETRIFKINYKDLNITRPDNTLYGADVTYDVEFLEMLQDAQYDPIFELTPTHPIAIGSLILIGILIFLVYYTELHTILYQRIQKLRTPRCEICGTRTGLYCGFASCKKTICRSCFSKEGGCPFCHRNKLVGHK